MFNVLKKKQQTHLVPIYDASFLNAIAQQEIIKYRVKLLSGINYARLLFAGVILWYFYAVAEKDALDQSVIGANTNQYDHAQLFWVTFSAYILLLLFCNTALLYKTFWRWIFIGMAMAEVSLLTLLLALVFRQGLANVHLMLIVSSILLSVLTLSYVESIVFALFTACGLCLYLLMGLVDTQLLAHSNNTYAAGYKLFMLWSLLKQNQLELVNPIIYTACLMLMVVMVGFLASQARDNKIYSHLNHHYNNQLRKLNDSIIEDIKSGLIVVNAKGVILTLNQQAKKIFNLQQQTSPPGMLLNLSASLAQHFNRWLYSQYADVRTIEIDKASYSVGFDTLQQHQDVDLTLITLESVEESMQRIREARLLSLGRLSAGIAHEIRNPLASIQSAADLLQETSTQENAQYLIEKITHNSKRINVIISDVLNMFNELNRKRELIHLNSELKKIIAQMQQDALTKDAAVQLDLSRTASFYVYFDSGQLTQIINNLIMNALIHGGRDNITVTITGQVSKIGRQLYLDVSDNGLGVHADDQDKLFEPFFSKKNGTGLGLYLIREMCLANQAQIVFLPQATGARFRITMERYLNSEVSQ